MSKHEPTYMERYHNNSEYVDLIGTTWCQTCQAETSMYVFSCGEDGYEFCEICGNAPAWPIIDGLVEETDIPF